MTGTGDAGYEAYVRQRRASETVVRYATLTLDVEDMASLQVLLADLLGQASPGTLANEQVARWHRILRNIQGAVASAK